MTPARFDAELPEHAPVLPPRLARQLAGPRIEVPRWWWLLRRGWDEVHLRRELVAAESRELVKQLVETCDLDQSQWRVKSSLQPHFEAFLARELHPHARPREGGEQCLSFPLDGAHRLVPLTDPGQRVTLPPWRFAAGELFPGEEIWERHRGGMALVSRPALTDCHRTAFPAAGIPGQPLSLCPGLPAPGPRVLQRWVERGLPRATRVPFASRHGGSIELLELGGCGPGGVVQSFRPGDPVQRGTDKAWFRFGRPWAITWFAPDRLLADDDLPLDEQGDRPERALRALRGQRLGVMI